MTFGAVLPVFFAIIGLLVEGRIGPVSLSRAVWGVGGILTVAYFAVPPIRRPVFLGWSYATYPIGWVVSHALLVLIYWGVISPIGLLLRAMGRDPLSRRLERSVDSYWRQREGPRQPRRYFDQF